MSENSPRPMPPYVSSPSFAAIAEALGTDTQQTVEFIETVRRTAGRGKLIEILTFITKDGARTPDEVALRLRKSAAGDRRLQSLSQRPKRKYITRRFAGRSQSARYVWNPNTKKYEPRALPDPDDLHW